MLRISEEFHTKAARAKKGSVGGRRQSEAGEVARLWVEVKAVARQGLGWETSGHRELNVKTS